MQAPFGKVALVTGAGSGIGRELSRQLAAQGVAIAAVDIAEDGLDSLANELQAKQQRIATAVADVTRAAELGERVAELENALGPTDLLIASAGIGFETTAASYHADEIAAIINVNLIGVSNSIAAVLPGMMDRRQGHIVGISSLASYRGLPRMFAYTASKAGLNSLLEGLRIELHDYKIAVTTICPGWIRTPMTAQIKMAMPDIMEPGRAGRQILEAVRRRRIFCAFPSGAARRLNLLRTLPCAVSDWIVRKMLARYRAQP